MSQLGLEMSTEGPPPRRRAGGVVAVVLALLVVGGLVYGLVSVTGPALDGLSFAAEDYAGPGTGEVVVEVQAGESLTAIGQTLEDRDVVASARAFTDAAAAAEGAEGVQPGFYQLQQRMPAAAAVATLLDPEARVLSQVTVPEGLRLSETLELLAAETDIPIEDYRAALEEPGALGLPAYAQGRAEGFLFPATYDVPPDATATDVLTMMVRRFKQAAEAVGLDAAARSPYEIVTIASLVEAEAQLDGDFPKVARVVENRLARDMRLQFDSTVNYALEVDKERVTNNDLDVESPYNTYTNAGLPPGPISSPGEQALRAALQPAAGDWIYFVTTDLETGETKFTSSYDEFLTFKAELQRNRDGS